MGVDRVTIQDAARLLGVSEGAVRKKVTRGTLKHDKEEDGRIYVYLDERDTRGVDDGVYKGVGGGVAHEPDALISQLRDEIAYLRDENRRKDEIIMQQAITMRQLTAAEETPHAPETAPNTSEGAEPPHDAPRPQAGAQHPGGAGGDEEGAARRSWWRRWFGFD